MHIRWLLVSGSGVNCGNSQISAATFESNTVLRAADRRIPSIRTAVNLHALCVLCYQHIFLEACKPAVIALGGMGQHLYD